MAKSLRSKWARARRSDKREKYAKKELAKLKQLVSKREMREKVLNDIATVVNKIKIEPKKDGTQMISMVPTVKKQKKPKLTSQYDPKTLQNKHGNFPVWMNRRAIAKFKSKNPNLNKKKRPKRK